MEKINIYWKAFLEACRENRIDVVKGFCAKDFNPYDRDFTAFSWAIERADSPALDVIEYLLLFDSEKLSFAGREHLLSYLLAAKCDDVIRRDAVCLAIAKHPTYSHYVWSQKGYEKWEDYGALFLAMLNAPRTFRYILERSSPRDDKETAILVLTQYYESAYIQDNIKSLFEESTWLPSIIVWRNPQHSGMSFADYYMTKVIGVGNFLNAASEMIRAGQLFKLRVMFGTTEWKEATDKNACILSFLRLAHQCEQQNIKEFLLCEFEKDDTITLASVLDLVCEMPELACEPDKKKIKN